MQRPGVTIAVTSKPRPTWGPVGPGRNLDEALLHDMLSARAFYAAIGPNGKSVPIWRPLELFSKSSNLAQLSALESALQLACCASREKQSLPKGSSSIGMGYSVLLRSAKIMSALALAIGAVGTASVSLASAAAVPGDSMSLTTSVMLQNVATGKCLTATNAGTGFAEVLVQD